MNVRIRRDSWTTDEENLLKEIVLKKIEQGLTQISGFKEASILLGRTKQACAFRWNKNLRPIVFQRKTPSKEAAIKDVSDSLSVPNHMQLAMESYFEMKQSYEQISQEYNLLKRDYEQLVNYVRQGIKHIEQ